MQTEQSRSKSLTYLTVYPDEYDPEKEYPLVILLHGFGVNMHDLAGLTPALDRKGYIYVCPNAPIPMNMGPGMIGWAWALPTKSGSSEESEDIKRTQRRLEKFFDEVMEKHRIPPGRALLLGFSQGGGMTYRCGLPRPDLFTGLVALSCSIQDSDEIRLQLPPQRSQSVFIAHGLHDTVERARSTKAFLEEEGYHLSYKEYEMGHEITQEVLDDLILWISQVLPPISL